MGLYIKDMEMPKDVTLLAISPDGTVDIISGQPDLSWKTLKHKAISVSPHGRLIDADKLIEFIENRYEITWKDDYEGGIKDACVDILEKISTMPTAIQASVDEL